MRKRKAEVGACDAAIQATIEQLGAATTAEIAAATGQSMIVVGGRLYYLHKAGRVKKAGSAGERNASLWAAPSEADRLQYQRTGSFVSDTGHRPVSRAGRVVRLTDTRHNARGMMPYGASVSGTSTLEYVTCQGH